MKTQIPLLLLGVGAFFLTGCGTGNISPPTPPPTPPTPPVTPMVTIASPTSGADLTATPVTLQVNFANGADPTQLIASLNGRDISTQFGPAVNGARSAKVDWPDVNIGRNTFLAMDAAAQATTSFRVDVALTQNSVGRLIPIQTRVVTGDGTHPGDYSVVVGSNSYQAPDPGDGAVGFQVVQLDRATLNLVSNVSYPTSTTDQVNTMISALTPNQFNVNYENCGVLGCILVIQSLNEIGQTPCGTGTYNSSCATSSYASLFANLGGSGDISAANGTQNFASYSLLTNISQGGVNDFSLPAGSGYERLACTSNNITTPNCGTLPVPGFDSTGTAQTSGVLILDNHDAYTFAYNARPVTFSTGVGGSSTQNTITVNGVQYASSSISPGQGAFQLVVLNRTTLALITNQTFTFDQLGIMLDNIESLDNYNELFFVASIGSMFHSTSQDIAWYLLGEAIQQIGGTYETFVQVNDSTGLDDYSLVGAASNPNSGLMPFYGAEASSVISIPTLGARTRSNIQGILSVDHQGYFSPALSSLNSTFGENNLALVTAASLQLPKPFPFPETGNAGQSDAYVWISQALCCDDIRGQYTNLNASATLWLSELQGLHFPADQSFSMNDFYTMKDQLLTEFQYVALVRLFETNIADMYQNQQSNVSLLLSQAYNTIQNALHPPPTMTIRKPSPLQIAEGALPIGEDLLSVAGPPGAVAKAGVDTTLFTIRLCLEEANDGHGAPLAPPTRVQVAEITDADLAGDAANTFAASLVTLGNGFDRILTDWGRLQAVGEPLASGQITWTPDAAGFALQGFDISARREYFEKFFAALYGIEHVEKASVGNLPDQINSSCTGKSYLPVTESTAAFAVAPTLQQPTTDNDQQIYDGYLLLGNQKCSNAPSALPSTFDLFGNIDPNQPNNLGEYRPYFFTRGPVPIIKVNGTADSQSAAPLVNAHRH